MLENLWLIAPGPSLYTLQEVNDAVEGFYYNDSSNFAALQSGILSVTKALIVENSLVIDGVEKASFTIDENTTVVATITETDPQSDALTYSISGGADAALYQIDENAGVLSFINAQDHETALDAKGKNVYDVTVVSSPT